MCLLGGSLGEQRNFLGWGIVETDIFISRWNWRFLRDSMRLIYLTFRQSWTSSNRKLKLNYNFCFLFSAGKSKANFIRIQNSSCSRNISTSTFDTPRIGYSHIPTYFWYIWTRRETAYCALTIVNPGLLTRNRWRSLFRSDAVDGIITRTKGSGSDLSNERQTKFPNFESTDH